jgi:hypothetical protein
MEQTDVNPQLNQNLLDAIRALYDATNLRKLEERITFERAKAVTPYEKERIRALEQRLFELRPC